MRRAPHANLNVADSLMCLDGIIPLDKPYTTAVNRRVPFVYVVHTLERQFVSLVSEQFFHALCVTLGAFGITFGGNSSRGQITGKLAFDKFISDIAPRLCRRGAVVDFQIALVLLAPFYEILVRVARLALRVFVQGLKKV